MQVYSFSPFGYEGMVVGVETDLREGQSIFETKSPKNNIEEYVKEGKYENTKKMVNEKEFNYHYFKNEPEKKQTKKRKTQELDIRSM